MSSAYNPEGRNMKKTAYLAPNPVLKCDREAILQKSTFFRKNRKRASLYILRDLPPEN